MAVYDAPPRPDVQGLARIPAYLADNLKHHYIHPPYLETNLSSAFIMATILSTVSYYIFGPEVCPSVIPLSLFGASLLAISRHKNRFERHKTILIFDSSKTISSPHYNPNPDIFKLAEIGAEETREDLSKVAPHIRKKIEEAARRVENYKKSLPTSSPTTTSTST